MFAPVLIIALVSAIAMIVAYALASRRARRRDEASPVVSLTLTLSAVWAIACVVGAVWVLVDALVSPDVAVTIPVATYWPELMPGVEIGGATATVRGGGFTEADVVLSGLSLGARLSWGIGGMLGWLTPAAIAALIGIACFQLLAGRAFTPVVARVATITSAVVLAGGLGAQILTGIGGSVASHEALTVTAAEWTDIAGIEDPLVWWPDPTMLVQLDFWPIGAALAFAALAAVFRYGSRLQRDTEGLV